MIESSAERFDSHERRPTDRSRTWLVGRRSRRRQYQCAIAIQDNLTLGELVPPYGFHNLTHRRQV